MKRKQIGDRLMDVPVDVFACDFSSDPDPLARACAPQQPDDVAEGQEWMNLVTGSVLPVQRLHDGYIDLGHASYTVVLTTEQLRAGWVCIDLPPLVPTAAISQAKGRSGHRG